MQERKSKLAMEKEAIKRANSVLIVGGGTSAVEIMGELIHHYYTNLKNSTTGQGSSTNNII